LKKQRKELLSSLNKCNDVSVARKKK